MTESNSSLIVGITCSTSASNGRSFSSSIDEAISGIRPWKLPSEYQRPDGILATVCHSGGVFTSPRPTSSTRGIAAAVRAHVELDVRCGERGRSRARQRIDLVVMMAVTESGGRSPPMAACSPGHGPEAGATARLVSVFSDSPSHLSSNTFVPAPRYATPSISAVWQTRQLTVQLSGCCLTRHWAPCRTRG